MFAAAEGDARELEFREPVSAKLERKEVPNGDQVAVIREDLRRYRMFEERILLEHVTSLFLKLSLFPEELRSLGLI
jgi:hypothetical protein